MFCKIFRFFFPPCRNYDKKTAKIILNYILYGFVFVPDESPLERGDGMKGG